MLYCIIVYYIILYYSILYYVIVYYSILYYIMLYYIVLYYIVLYCIILSISILCILYYIYTDTYIYTHCGPETTNPVILGVSPPSPRTRLSLEANTQWVSEP